MLGIATALLAVGIAIVLARNVRAAIRERRLLRSVLRDLGARPRIERREDLVSVKNFLNRRIFAHPALKDAPRPLLRASATETLATGRGYCGENARVAILLLQAGGVRAHRLYLRGPRWGHVIVEHEWQGGWRLFDGHAEPATRFADEDVARIVPEAIGDLPCA
ncbi:MAG: transglutaminase domain-containing protein [Candidatus Rokubacteria bacterium]|nr:transglutaminase domain-containing protein [Candidatus Rokubacteria bacterium]